MSFEVCQFGDFEADRGAYELRRDGRPLKLERIPLDLLFLLLERRGQLVTREEILERIWGKGIFLDVDNAINSAVRKLRRALHDDPQAPRFVMTVPTKGYRFAEVATATENEPRAKKYRNSSASTSIVGRADELASLVAGLDDAAAGHGRMVFLVSGEPGIGKTRLADELASVAEERGFVVRLGHCFEEESLPFIPFVEMLEAFVDAVPEPDQLRREMGEQGPELTRLIPKLGRLLPDLPPPMELSPAQARRHLLTCFFEFMARLARRRPTLMIVEDLHWADDSTLAMLDFISQRISDVPLTVVGTYRDAEIYLTGGLARTLEDLLRARRATQVKLKGLPREQVAMMLNGLAGQIAPPGVTGEIFAETEGNPFFIEELFRYLEEENRLYDSEGNFHSELKIAEDDAPPSVRLVVGRRLARLSETAQQMLATAATIGRFFDARLLGAAAGSEAEAFLDCLGEAQRAGLTMPAAGSQSRFQFAHELVRQAVIATLSPARRQRLHLAIAEAIERTFALTLEDYWGELAFHYNQSSNAQKAVEYLGRAAVQASRGTAYEQAINYIRSALERLREWPSGEERNRLEIALQLNFAPALQNIRGQGSPAAEEPYLRAAELSREIDDPSQLFRAMNGLWGVYQVQAKFDAARRLAEQLPALAERLQNRLFQLGAHEAIATTCMWLGEFGSARAHLEKAIGFYDRSKRRSKSAFRANQDPGVDCLSFLSLTLWYLGYPDQALRASNEAMVLARELDHPYTLGYASVHAGMIRHWRGETKASLELMDGAIEICGKHGFPFFLGIAK
ncbi:MAG TPA: AAA family ATPase, partial [Candidatus Binataceae bacterium]|nr:AAA family ATPase [Candidatus Binataceae bacterium]